MAPGHIDPRDDELHFDRMSDRWWETETCWYSFHNAERCLGGWLYVMLRPNIGTVAGGAWVWDGSASLPWEVLYSANYTCLRLPDQPSLRDLRLPTGVHVQVLEPLERHRLGYEDGDRLKMALEFEAVMPPVGLTQGDSGFGNLGHFDQFGRVTGEIVLHGERIAIDSLSMRDRSWGPRPEHRPRSGSYVTGIAHAGHSFLVMTNQGSAGDNSFTHGFLMRDGVLGRWVEGRRKVARDPSHGGMVRIVLEGTDDQGRRMHATGEMRSRIVLNRHTFIDSNSLVNWTLDGDDAWGEDQDMWTTHEFSAMRRSQSGKPR